MTIWGWGGKILMSNTRWIDTHDNQKSLNMLMNGWTCHYDEYMGHYDEYIVCIIMASLSNVLFREMNRVSTF